MYLIKVKEKTLFNKKGKMFRTKREISIKSYIKNIFKCY